MATGDLMRRDGAADVALAISGPRGPELLVYEGQDSIFMRGPVRAALPAMATAIAAGELDDDRMVDIAVAADSDLVIVHGYDRLAGNDAAEIQGERIGFPFRLRSIAVGEFIWDREGKPEVAILSDAGMVHIASRGELDRRGFTQDEILDWARQQGKHRSPYTQAQLDRLRERLDELGYPKTASGNRPARQQTGQWAVAESHRLAEQTSEGTSLIVANLSGGSPLDLMMVDPAGHRLHLLMGEREVFAGPDRADNNKQPEVRRERPPALGFEVAGEPVAALALNLNFDTRPDLVVLRKDHLSAVITPSAPLATFTVDRTDDNAGASACTAAANDCSLRGAFKAANASAGPDSIVVPSGTYTLTLGPADDDALVLSNENAGDLDIRGIFDGGSPDNDITLTGAGAATTIIQASVTAGSGIDRVVDVDPVFGGGALNFSVSGVTLRHGRAQAPNSAGGDGGAIRYLGAQLPHSPAAVEGTLTITDCTISNNQSTNPTAGAPGGAINIVFGKVNISGSTFSSNNAGNGAGGAILFDGGLEGDSQLTISSATFSSNTTLNATNGNGGALFSTGGRSVSLTNTSFSNNQAAVDGGGYRISITQTAGTVMISGGSYTGNRAGRHGGGIYSDPQDTGSSAPVTISNATFSGNVADNDGNNTGDGGGIFHNRGILTLTSTSMSGTANTAVNGGGLAHRFVSGVSPSNTSTISINGGSISGNTATAEGGAIFQDSTNEAGTGSVINIGTSSAVTIQSNTARTNGGAIANLNSGDVNITGGAVSGNTADSDNNNNGDGGGIYNSNAAVVMSGGASIGQSGSANNAVNGGGVRHVSGTMTMTGGSVSFNTAKNNGGGVSAAATVTFNSGVSFTNNSANVSGGAVHITAGTANINGGGVIQGNTADNDNNGTGDGGGIFNGGATVLLPNSTTIGGAGALRNAAANGGGIFNSSGSVTMTGGSITGNQAAGSGGGAGMNGGTIALSGVSITGNSATVSGGGIFRDGGTLTLTNNVTIGASGQPNTAANGGGIANNSGTLTVNSGNATLTNNTATTNGGGIFTGGGIVNLNNLSLTDNGAANGGAAAAIGGTTNITGSQIINNTATANGGGIFNNGGTFMITLSRFFGNTAASGTAVHNAAGTVTAENNWWGCDDFPASGTTGCQTAVGTVDADPRIDLRLLPNPAAVPVNGVSTLKADVTQNTAGAVLPGGFPAVLEGLTATFATDAQGTITPPLTQPVASGMATRTWTAGPAGGTSTVSVMLDNGTQTAEIIIQEPPQITCPNDVTVNTDPGLCTASVPFIPIATGSPAPTVTCTIGLTVITSPHNFPVGISTVTCTASNGVPPDATCSFTVTVIDNQPPVIGPCPADINVTESPTGSGTAIVNYTPPTATDNCGATVVCSPASGTAFPVGSTTVTCTATDPSNQTSTCSFSVTVNPACTLTCPASVSVNNDPGQCGAAVTFSDPATTGNCGAITCSPPSGSFFPIGTTTVTCTAASGPGCTFTVTVVDNTPPVITCPANITVGNDAGQCSAVVSFTVSATDNCPGVTVVSSPPSGSTFPLGTTTVTATATDASGNTATCSFTITVNDTEPPQIACPADISVNNDPGQCTAVVNYAIPTPTDNCPGVGAAVCAPASGAAFAIGTTTVTCTASDAAGNTASCSFTVTVVDNMPPTITCPANITVNTDPGNCSAVVTFNPTISDNCPGATTVCAPASGSVFPKGTTTVDCTVTDASNNTATCSFTVTVNDAEAPQLTCPANITQGTDPNLCTAVVNYPVTATDNCPGVGAPVCAPASGSAFPKGTTTVNCSVADTAGNSSSCSFTVTVNDTQLPAISCPANIIVNNGPGQCTAVVNYTVTATDNCPGVMVTVNPPSGSTFPVGTTMVTATATDAMGNSSTCTFTVTVVDATPPQIICPPSQTAVTTSAGGTGVIVNYPPPTLVDNCPGATVVCTPPSGSIFPAGTTAVNCTASDPSGNSVSCSFTVTVFNVCLQDDSDPSKVLLFNSFTGEFRFCCSGTTFIGTGNVIRQGASFTLQVNSTNRRVLARLDSAIGSGSASLESPPGTLRCTIRDRNINDNTCSCQ
jgi:hypothetical protein